MSVIKEVFLRAIHLYCRSSDVEQTRLRFGMHIENAVLCIVYCGPMIVFIDLEKKSVML